MPALWSFVFNNVNECTHYNVIFKISVGKPISVLKTDQPTQEQIDSTHKAYVQALKELYEEYNPIYGDPSINLNFI